LKSTVGMGLNPAKQSLQGYGQPRLTESNAPKARIPNSRSIDNAMRFANGHWLMRASRGVIPPLTERKLANSSFEKSQKPNGERETRDPFSRITYSPLRINFREGGRMENLEVS
jgi:hypothetical protein